MLLGITGRVEQIRRCRIDHFLFGLVQMDLHVFTLIFVKQQGSVVPDAISFRERVGNRKFYGAARFALATDIGCVRDGWLKYVAGCDAVLLESNYDPDMLKAGPYPYDLKKRILSRRGHLSNDDAGETAGELIRAGTRQIILGHLSKENNFPELALQTAQSLLRVEGIDPEEDVDLRVARRDAITGLFAVGAAMD